MAFGHRKVGILDVVFEPHRITAPAGQSCQSPAPMRLGGDEDVFPRARRLAEMLQHELQVRTVGTDRRQALLPEELEAT